MELVLSATGNPDRGQYGDIGVPTQRVQVASYVEASKAVRTYIQAYALGGGNWTGGELSLDGKPVAHVSYNGRVWEGARGVNNTPCLYDPRPL